MPLKTIHDLRPLCSKCVPVLESRSNTVACGVTCVSHPPCAFRPQHKRCNDKVFYLWALTNTNVRVYNWRQGISQEVWRQRNRNLQSEACAWHWQFCFEKLVGHIVIELSFLIDCFLQARPDNFIIVETTGPEGKRIALVVPGKLTTFTKSAAIGQKLREQITHSRNSWKRVNGKETTFLNRLSCSWSLNWQ